jgi:hypothetical protein
MTLGTLKLPGYSTTSQLGTDVYYATVTIRLRSHIAYAHKSHHLV